MKSVMLFIFLRLEPKWVRIKSQRYMHEQSTNVFTSPRIEGSAEDSQFKVGLTFVHPIWLSANP